MFQIDEYASKRDLVIAGYYAAPDNIKEYSFDKLSSNRIFDKIAANSSQAFMIVVRFSCKVLILTYRMGFRLMVQFQICSQVK